MRGRDHGVRLTFYGTDLLRADRPSGDVPRGDHGDGHCGILPRHDADRQRLRAAADTGADRIGGPRHRHRHRAGHGVVYLGGERRPAQPDAAGAILLYGGGRDAGVVADALGHRTVVVGRGAGRDGAEAVCPRAAGGDADRLHPRPVPVLQRHGGGPCSPRPAQGSTTSACWIRRWNAASPWRRRRRRCPPRRRTCCCTGSARGSPAAVWWAASWC